MPSTWSSGSRDDYLQVTTTVPSAEAGDSLAHSITEQRLAAGVQIIGPIRSVYWWQNSLRDEQEWLLLIKTTRCKLEALITHITNHHTYVTPEIVATDIVAGSDDYLAWISKETRRTDA